ncbi:hypothetical protein E4U21_006167, partial [Claviceps maximensis]
MRLQPAGNSSDDAYFAHDAGGDGGIAVPHHHHHHHHHPHPQSSLGQLPPSNQLDDVFGSAPASPDQTDVRDHSHPSDIPRLQTEHATAGYREGITAAKESSIQPGFDEGFSLGAALGSHAGRLLGL